MVCRHVVIELGSIVGVVPKELKEVRIGFVSQLEGTVFTVGGKLVVVLSEEGWQGLHASRNATSPLTVSTDTGMKVDMSCLHARIGIAESRHPKRNRESSPTVFVGTGLVDHTMGGQMFEDPDYQLAYIKIKIKKRVYTKHV